MVDVLTGFTWDRSASRYRSSATGRYVARNEIVTLLGTHISSGESRVESLTRAIYEGKIAPSVCAEQMRTELRRLHLQNAALGAGGWDRLRASDYGRIGQRLREDYGRINRLINDVRVGNVTLPQALNRANGYIGNSRIAFWETERAAQSVPEPGKVIIERRLLGAQKNCRDCLNYYAAGWQLLGVLPVPGVSCACGTNCKCRMERRQVSAEEAGQYVKRSLSDAIAAEDAKRAAALEAAVVKKTAKVDKPKEKKGDTKAVQKAAKVDSATTLDQLRQRVSSMPEDKALGELAKLNTKINKAENAGNDKLSEQLQDQRRVYLQVLGDRRKLEDEKRKTVADIQQAERKQKLADARLALRRYGVTVESEGAVADMHLQHYEMIPDKLKSEIASQRVRVFINNNGTLPDIDEQGALRGVRPRGWPEGKTWDIVPGAYNQDVGYVLAGKGAHGSSSVLLHEYGHAVGDKLGYDFDVRVINAHRNAFKQLDPYFQQDGPGGWAGVQEFFAESFAQTVLDRNAAIRSFGREIVDIIESSVFDARPGVSR